VYHVIGFDLAARPLKLYATQLGLNLLWPLLFFKARKLGLSVLLNLALLATSIATTGASRLPPAGHCAAVGVQQCMHAVEQQMQGSPAV